MSRFFTAIAVVAAVLLSGCAASVNRPSTAEPVLSVPASASKRIVFVVTGANIATASKDWEALRGEWRTAMAAATAAAGVDFVYQDGESTLQSQPGTLVVLKVNDYRYISAGARFGLGIMTGNAYIDAEAQFFDAPTRRALGRRSYTTSSSAWQGVFSAMTSKQVEAISTEIVRAVTGR